METLFVYGTLKKNYINHYLLTGAEFLGRGTTLEKYSLYASGIPYVVECEAVSQIRGEIYRLNEQTLAAVDRLEGHPSFYERKKIKVLLDRHRSAPFEAWLYFSPHPTGSLITSGEFKK